MKTANTTPVQPQIIPNQILPDSNLNNLKMILVKCNKSIQVSNGLLNVPLLLGKWFLPYNYPIYNPKNSLILNHN